MPAGAAVPASMTGLAASAEKAPLDKPQITPTVDATDVPVVDNAANGRPTYSTAAGGTGAVGSVDESDEAPTPRMHVVHNGDTLGRLAKRYLGDEGRALEIFDLNRDVLSNPHLLPIGAELRIPADIPAAQDRSANRRSDG